MPRTHDEQGWAVATEGKSQAELALTCADEMMIRASQVRQMGFPEVARFLVKNANAARKWAAKQP